jgi:hypothetical protein
MRGQARWSPVLVQRAVSEDPRWTRAVGDHLACPPGRREQRPTSVFRRAPLLARPLERIVSAGGWEGVLCFRLQDR